MAGHFLTPWEKYEHAEGVLTVDEWSNRRQFVCFPAGQLAFWVLPTGWADMIHPGCQGRMGEHMGHEPRAQSLDASEFLREAEGTYVHRTFDEYMCACVHAPFGFSMYIQVACLHLLVCPVPSFLVLLGKPLSHP